MTPVIFRRRRLGLTSAQGVVDGSTTGIRIHTNNPLRRTARREGAWPERVSHLFRWGCTATPPVPVDTTVNTAAAIHTVNDKVGFRRTMMEQEGEPLCPRTWFHYNDVPIDDVDVIMRPAHHAQGRNLHVCRTYPDLHRAHQKLGRPNDYYISELIDKAAEYRVFVAQGRAVWVAQKTPGNPDDVAWNVARGGRFDNVRFNDWPLRVVRVAIESFNLSGLDFGGVDVIVGQDGAAYTIEINSAPSQTSPYRQSCVAKVFDWIVRNGKQPIPLIQERGGYLKFIHPAVNDNAILTGD